MIRDARLSADRQYRYALWWIWNKDKPGVLFIGLNPSTADEREDDSTIQKCVAYGRRWGYGRLYMGNLFAYRSTDRGQLRCVSNPVGPDNDEWLLKLRDRTAVAIAAWGDDGCLGGRDKLVYQLLPGMKCLGVTRAGQPRHPLYLAPSLVPIDYRRKSGGVLNSTA